MNTTLKYYLLTILLLTGLTSWANPKGRPSVEEMHQKKWEYLKEAAALTATEAKAVKPIFMEYEENTWKLNRQNRSNRPKKNEKPDYKALNDNYINKEVEQTEHLLLYHQKLQKQLSPEKLFNYYRAERSYKRKLIYEMQQNHQKHRSDFSVEKK